MLSTARVLWISISIHALREEGDLLAEIVKPVELISIHALREEGDAFWLQRPCWVLLFLSTPSARRATKIVGIASTKIFVLAPPPSVIFTPPPPLLGYAMLFFSGSKHRKFLSTPSARRATAAFSAWPAGMSISIHALREEGDPAACR